MGLLRRLKILAQIFGGLLIVLLGYFALCGLWLTVGHIRYLLTGDVRGIPDRYVYGRSQEGRFVALCAVGGTLLAWACYALARHLF